MQLAQTLALFGIPMSTARAFPELRCFKVCDEHRLSKEDVSREKR